MEDDARPCQISPSKSGSLESDEPHAKSVTEKKKNTDIKASRFGPKSKCFCIMREACQLIDSDIDKRFITCRNCTNPLYLACSVHERGGNLCSCCIEISNAQFQEACRETVKQNAGKDITGDPYNSSTVYGTRNIEQDGQLKVQYSYVK